LAELCCGGNGSALTLLASGRRHGEGEKIEGVEGSGSMLVA
jgi:hypothetical protein